MEGNGSWSRTLDRPNASMWWIAAGAQKHDKGSDMLTLAVASGGINLAQKFATSKYGVATLAWQNKVGPSEPDPIPDPTPDPTPTALSFTGSTDTVTSSFRLASGIAIFSMTYSGSGHFAIWLKNAITGAQEELLANEIEAYNGSVLVSVTDSLSAVHPGMYYLEVTADASWRIQGRQPVSASASSLPVTLTGQTDSVPSPVWLTPGAVRFQMSYTGTDLFSIVLYGSDGEYVDLLVNRIGTCSGAASVSITSAGSYYLAVNGIGSWSITVTHL